MTEKLKQIMGEEIAGLSKENQEAINSFDWATVSEEIGLKHSFSESDINDLQVGIGLVLLGLGDFDWYKTHVENEIGTTKEEAEQIADEVLQKIFTPIASKIEEVIQSKVKGKNNKWDQNLDFILSGGDYSAFVEDREEAPTPDTHNDINYDRSRIEDIKSKFVI